MTMADITTGGTVNRSVRNTWAVGVFAAIDAASTRFPLSLVGVDPDNRSESINAHLVNDCLSRQITFTPSRSPTKSDGAHVR